jgi:polyhydroxyalkanoate synthesis repressor PhaR
MSIRTSPTTIKKYANRRLYNTASSSYVTLADLSKMVKVGEDFVVYDAKTNEDITRQVLAQIIFEQEGVEGQALLPIAFLRQLIRCYGDGVQSLLPSYLEYSIDQFAGEKQAIREAAGRAFGPGSFSSGAFGALKELTRKNLAAFNRALGLLPPAGGEEREEAGEAGKAAPPPAAAAAPMANADLEELRVQLAEVRRRLDSLSEKR